MLKEHVRFTVVKARELTFVEPKRAKIDPLQERSLERRDRHLRKSLSEELPAHLVIAGDQFEQPLKPRTRPV